MSEERIERMVEVMTNSLDRRFTTTDMSQKEYEAKLKAIDAWADRERQAQARA